MKITNKTLGEIGVKAFESRGISAETAARYGVYTVSRDASAGEAVPDPRGNIVAFPYLEHDVEVSTKYRAPGKKFWQREGGKRTFWNADVLDDAALHEGRNALVITEGEIDALTALECGYPFTVSVPDGAPAVPQGKTPEDLEPLDEAKDTEGKFEFMWNNRDRLRKIKRFIIASDADGPGRRLAAELVRRLGAAKCSFVAYPPDPVVLQGDGSRRPCKDLNDVLAHFGRDRVINIIATAKPYPVRGLYRLSEYPEHDELETFSVGFDGWKNRLRVFPGEFMVVTGIPSHGKTQWVMNLVSNLVTAHGWRAAICSPEMPTVPQLRDRLRRYWIGHKPVLGEGGELERADDWINRRFVFIDIDPTGTGESDEAFDLNWLIERATDAVLRDGIRILVIDPWNEIEHAREKGETGSDYVARGIRALKRFARLYSVVVIVVAHPTKEVGKGGATRLANLYDVEGSAAWVNKADHGIVVERDSDKTNKTNIHIQKVRFEETGRKGTYEMTYNTETGRYEPLDAY